MQAIILAAGMGKRLGELTKNNTKCMVEVNGVTLIDRMLTQLSRLPLERVVIVVGYEGRKLIDYIGNRYDSKLRIEYVENPIYILWFILSVVAFSLFIFKFDKKGKE